MGGTGGVASANGGYALIGEREFGIEVRMSCPSSGMKASIPGVCAQRQDGVT